MKRRELVVRGRDERHELLVDDRLPLGVMQRLLDARVDDAHFGRRVLHVVIDELGVVLRAHAGEVAALGLGDAQTLERVLDVVGHGLPVMLLIGVGLDVGDDVVHVEALDRGAPRRVGKTVEDFKRFETQLEHPLRLVLLGADLAHDVGRDTGFETLETLLAISEVIEAAVDVRDLGTVLCHACAPSPLRLLGGCGLCLGALLGGLALERLEAVLVDPGDKRRVVLADDMALDHHVDAVDVEVLEDAGVVGDDEHGAVAVLAVGVHAMGDGGEGVDIEAGVRLVEDGELGLQQQELEHLDLLFLAAREAHAQFAVEVCGVHVELGRELLDAAAELLALHLEAGAAGDARAQKARQGHAGDLDGGLEAQEQASTGALVGREVGDVLAVEVDAAVVHGVDGVTHDQVAEGRLAGAVGAHEDMGLAGGDIEVDVMEDGLLVHGGGEALDVEQRVFAHGFPLFCSGFTAAQVCIRKP